MPILHVYGIDHSRASLAVREQLAFSAEEAGELIPVLLAGPDPADCRGAVREAMLLSTCNRTEVYLVTDGEPAGFPLEPLCRHRPEMQWLDNPELRYHLREQEASAHLFAVAASLRSQVPGDTQIASQVAAAAAVARSADTLGPLLEQVVARALRSAKRVRRETGLMAGSAGTGAAVLQALRRMMPDGPRVNRPVTVMLLGAGEMAAEVAAQLVRSEMWSGGSHGCRPIQIAGVWARDREKAVRFGESFGISPLSFREAAQALPRVDAVVAACRGRIALLSEITLLPVIQRRVEPLVVLDLGVPRNLEPYLADQDGLEVIVLDQLHLQMRERYRQRGDALLQARQIVGHEVLRFEQWRSELPVRPIRAEMYASVETVLSKWRTEQPGAVRHLRAAIHRGLEQAFGTLGLPAGVSRPPCQHS